MARPRTTDNIALGIEIRGIYDGICCWLMTDGRIINRFDDGEWPRGMREATQRWIDANSDALRAANADLITEESHA